MRQVTSPISSMHVRYKPPQRFEKVEDSTFHSRMKNKCPQGRQVSKHGIPGFKFLNLLHKHSIGQITPVCRSQKTIFIFANVPFRRMIQKTSAVVVTFTATSTASITTTKDHHQRRNQGNKAGKTLSGLNVHRIKISKFSKNVHVNGARRPHKHQSTASRPSPNEIQNNVSDIVWNASEAGPREMRRTQPQLLPR